MPSDKERLDFIRQFGVGNIQDMPGGFYWPNNNCQLFCGETFEQAIDAAIDAAIRASKKRGGRDK